MKCLLGLSLGYYIFHFLFIEYSLSGPIDLSGEMLKMHVLAHEAW